MDLRELEPQSITIMGQPAWTFDALPAIGTTAPPLHLADADLKDWSLEDFPGKKKILNIAPSFDTPVCQLTAKRFIQETAAREDLVVLHISADLPFAQARFCESLSAAQNQKFLSTFRSPEFGMDYGTLIVEHAFMGLLARAVIVLDENNTVLHRQLVPEISHEPDYAAALAAC